MPRRATFWRGHSFPGHHGFRTRSKTALPGLRRSRRRGF